MPPGEPSSEPERIRVELALRSEKSNEADVRYSRAGHWIQRCGSGTLAAIYVLHAHCINRNVWTLQSSYERMPIRYADHMCAYRAQAPTLARDAVSQRMKDALGVAPIEFWRSNDDAYRLCVVNDASILVALRPDYSALSGLGQHGWIVTAASEPPLDYVLRYFAPAFGTNEDAATGSANVVAGAYWQGVLSRVCVKGKQFSTAGGLFEVHQDGPNQWVQGRAESCPL